MPKVTRYDANDCTVLIDGTFITGLGEDMISFEKEEAYFETTKGAQGDSIKNVINDDEHTLTLTVQPTSPQLPKLLSLTKRKDEFPVWVVNKALGIRLGGTKASIKEAPEISLGKEAEDLEFVFCVFDGVTENT